MIERRLTMDNLFNSDISIEKIAAFLDGNLSDSEMQDISSVIDNDANLQKIVDVSDIVDDNILLDDFCPLQNEISFVDFDIPLLENPSQTIQTLKI